MRRELFRTVPKPSEIDDPSDSFLPGSVREVLCGGNIEDSVFLVFRSLEFL